MQHYTTTNTIPANIISTNTNTITISSPVTLDIGTLLNELNDRKNPLYY